MITTWVLIYMIYAGGRAYDNVVIENFPSVKACQEFAATLKRDMPSHWDYKGHVCAERKGNLDR